MEKIDVFAYVLLPKYHNKRIRFDSTIPKVYSFTNI